MFDRKGDLLRVRVIRCKESVDPLCCSILLTKAIDAGVVNTRCPGISSVRTNGAKGGEQFVKVIDNLIIWGTIIAKTKGQIRQNSELARIRERETVQNQCCIVYKELRSNCAQEASHASSRWRHIRVRYLFAASVTEQKAMKHGPSVIGDWCAAARLYAPTLRIGGTDLQEAQAT